MTGDVYSVSLRRQPFNGQILKANIISFQAATSLVLTNFNLPFIAVVAETIKFVDPHTNNGIITEANWSPTRYQPPNPPSTPVEFQDPETLRRQIVEMVEGEAAKFGHATKNELDARGERRS